MAKYSVDIQTPWCKACGICIEFCPANVLGADHDGKATVLNVEDCTGCRLCEYRCPDFAIKVEG